MRPRIRFPGATRPPANGASTGAPHCAIHRANAVSFHRHLLAQRRGLAALARFVLRGPGKGPATVPGPVVERIVPAPSRALVRDFVRFAGGDPAQHGSALPPHLFSQWSLPVLLEAARELPYPPVKVINAGFRLQVLAPLEVGSALHVRGQLVRAEETDKRAEVTIVVETRTPEDSVALRAELDVIVPLPRSKSEATSKPRPERERIPEDARLLARRRLRHDAGLEFAELTGDVNPIHWLPAYARAVRFPNVILHGFGTAAIAYEAVGRALLSGRFDHIRAFEARFERPVVLPTELGVYVGDERAGRRDVLVGAAPGGPVCLRGAIEIAAGS